MSEVLIVVPGFVKDRRDPLDHMEQAGLKLRMVDYGLAGLNKDPDEFCRQLQGAEAVIVTAMDQVTRRIMASAPDLRMVGIRSAGFEGTDLEAATDLGILVTHNPGANRQPVADLAIGMMLSISRWMGYMDRGMRQGGYDELRKLGKDMHGATLGVIGLGRIGKCTAQRALGFEMKVLYHDLIDYSDFAAEHGLTKVPLDQLLRESDFVTLHLPLDDSTRNMIDARALSLMKPDAVLVNTCRGGVVDEAALKEALKNQALYGFGTDVYAQEPPTDRELLSMDNVLSTPHIAGITSNGLFNLAMFTARKVVQFIVNGQIPENVLNPEVLTKLKGGGTN